MPNMFEIEWTEDNQRIRDVVQLGNFDGNTEEAQLVIDRLWPVAFSGKRTDIKVGNVVGAGKVVRVIAGPSGRPVVPPK